MSRPKDTYKEIREFKYPNMIIRVHIPDLTDEERQRRMKQLHKATEELLKERLKNERNKNL